MIKDGLKLRLFLGGNGYGEGSVRIKKASPVFVKFKIFLNIIIPIFLVEYIFAPLNIFVF